MYCVVECDNGDLLCIVWWCVIRLADVLCGGV